MSKWNYDDDNDNNNSNNNNDSLFTDFGVRLYKQIRKDTEEKILHIKRGKETSNVYENSKSEAGM